MEAMLLILIFVALGISSWLIYQQRQRRLADRARLGSMYLGGLLNACLADVSESTALGERGRYDVPGLLQPYADLRHALNLYMNEWVLALTANDHFAGIVPRPCACRLTHLGGMVNTAGEVTHYEFEIEMTIGRHKREFAILTLCSDMETNTKHIWSHLKTLKHVRNAIKHESFMEANPIAASKL